MNPENSATTDGKTTISHGTAVIVMTLTAPNCPMAEDLVEQVRRDVMTVDGVKNVEVTLTFEPEWDRSRISEEALLDLGWL